MKRTSWHRTEIRTTWTTRKTKRKMSWTRKMSWSTEEEPNAHRKRKKKLNQNLVYHSADEDEVVAGSFLEGCPTFLEFWDLFDKVFADFQEQTYQLFSLRTSASMKARNRKIASEQAKAKKNALSWKAGRNSDKHSRTGGTLLPEAWDTYCRTFLCTHGMPFVSKGTGRRSHSKVRSTGCSARVNARVCLRPSGNGFHFVVSASGAHDHALTEHRWYSYAENRRIEDPQLREDVAVLSKAGAKPRGILSYLRAKKWKLMLLTDVHNLIHVVKKTFRGGRTDAERAIAELDEFIESATGNTAECIVDSETNVIRVVTFQSARQKRLFAAFPEVVLVDSTHGTNVNRYKLCTFTVHDVFGLGQYVQHALVQTEEKANLALSVDAFKRNNPQWSKIEVEMTDKAMHEKEVLHDAWPNARQLLCRWHVETWLKKQCSRLGGVGRAETMKLKVIMKELVNAESQEEYGDLKGSLLETLGNDKENRLYMSFMQHWDTTDEWVMFKRGDVPHLMNNTNNRLESKWGRINEVMDTHMTIDELISILTTLQGYAEERYLSEWHRVGSRVQINEDRELKSIRQLSTYAFRIVSDQYKLAVGPQANYSIDMDCEKTRLTNPATAKAHEVDPR
ncbi:hypothetical protein L915_10705, partial [Phytophthora nicotianae]